MPPPLTDSHLHLDDRRYDGDRDAVVEAAAAAGIGYLVTIGTTMATSRAAIALARRYPGVYATVAIHPSSALEFDDAALAELGRLATDERVVAIGEIGLDYYRDRAPAEKQRQAFEAQLGLAAERGLPIVIHDRDAHGDVLTMLTEWAPRLPAARPGIMHCFSGDRELARRCLDLGFSLSFAGPLTYKRNEELREVAKMAPLDRVLVETDAPYLSPEPYRGKRNEPARVRLVAECLAELRGLRYTEVAAATTANVRRVFGIGEAPTLASFSSDE